MVLPRADLVVTGGPSAGRVFLGLEEGFADAIAFWSGRVLATGSADEIAALIGPGTEVVRLEGRVAVPGFNDAHQHLLMVGRTLAMVVLRPDHGVTTRDEVLRRVAARAASLEPGAWIVGRGYDHTALDTGRHPTAAELDRVAPDNPVWLWRTCGHMGVANSRGLALAGIGADTAAPDGGHIETADGRLTGLVQENACDLFHAVLPKDTLDQLVDAIEAGGRLNLSHGITSVTDPAVGMIQGWDDVLAYQEAHRTGRLPVRMYQCLYGGRVGAPVYARALAAGLKTGLGDDRLRWGPMKLFTDGSAGGRTAWMRMPYLGEPETHGIAMYADDELWGYVSEYHRAGYRIATHAIGDAAIEQVLSAYERAIAETRDDPAYPTGRRHRIEHCGFTTPDQMARMVRHGILPVPQSVFIHEFGDSYVDVVGPDRAAASYPVRSWWNAGLKPSGSSDCPVSDLNPMKNLHAMVTRRTKSGTLLGGQERLTLEEAVCAQTHNGAYASFEEDRKGVLTPGRLGDLAVLDRDPFAADPDQLLETRCDLTVLDGRVVWRREG